jgi:DNA-binding beta-propeller fold protein YncE
VGLRAFAAPLAIAALLIVRAGPAQAVPEWGDALLRASRIENPRAAGLPARPQWQADPMNLFVVVETADDHVSLVDGDRFEVLHRFPSRPVQGQPAFTPDGRYLYLASRDGWISKYDIWNLTVVAEVRAGLELIDVAVSGDGRWVMAANASPRSLALFDADLRLDRTYALTTLDGRFDSRPAALYDAAPRQSFILVLEDLAELWEISYNVRAEPIFDGLVHDYRMKEGIAKPGFLGVRRVPLEMPMQALLFEPGYRYAIGAARAAGGGNPLAQVVNFDVRRAIAVIPTTGVPHLHAGIGFSWNDGTVLAYPGLDDAAVTVVDTKTWRIVKAIPTSGSGAYLSSHKQSAHAWVDFRMDPSSKDSITLIDKQSLAPVGQVREPGRTLSHVEFSRDGRYALASLQETDGAIIVFDTRTLREVKRLPMRKPAGNYNVANRISRAAAGAGR